MNEKILIIDDEPLILVSIERALAKVGYEVSTAMDKKSFSDALKDHKFNLIIMDVHLKGIGVDELVDEAKKAVPNAKILTISGSITPPDSKYFLQKPFKIDVLREKVREILDEP